MQKTAYGSLYCPVAVSPMRRFSVSRLPAQMIRIMRLLFFFLFVAFLSAHATGSAQTVTISGKDLSFAEIFSAVKQQTGYVVLFNKTQLPASDKVTLSVTDLPLTDLLDIILKDQPLSYIIKGKTIFLSRREPLLVAGSGIFPPQPVSGTIVDSLGNPIQGASVRLSPGNKGTSSAQNGTFSIGHVAPGNYVLEVSFIGYGTVRKAITVKENDPLDLGGIMLMPSALFGEEVTIRAGYYNTTDRKKTGSIVTVSGKDIENQAITSPLLALQGRVAGVEVMPTSGAPGAAVKIRIRGQNSVRTTQIFDGVDGNLPLYIIDGVPISSVPLPSGSYSIVSAGFDPLSTIDPSNIKSIRILKDADATSIYGSRGANGVVLVTTRNRQAQGSLSMDVKFYQGIGDVANRFKMLTTEQYREMRKEAIYNDGGTVLANYLDPELGPLYYPDLLFWDSTRHTNWQDVLVGGKTQTTNVETYISGGNAQTRFSIGGSYYREEMPYPGDFGYSRYGVNATINHRSADERLSIGFTANYGSNQSFMFDNSTLMADALWIAPNAPAVYDENGALNWEVGPSGSSTWNNPFALLRATHQSSAHSLIANGTVEYQLFGDIKLKTSLGLSRQDQDNVINVPISSLNPYGFDEKVGESRINNSARSSWIIEPQVVYARKLQRHNIDATMGLTILQDLNDIRYIAGYGYTSDALLGTLGGAATVRSSQESNTQYRYGAIFVRGSYEYDGRYLLSATARRDGSSRFGPANRFANFWSVGAAWIFTAERWLSNSRVLTFGKLRGSYGPSGNDGIGDSRFVKTYRKSYNTYYDLVGLQPASLFNADYAWEITRKAEAALEAELFNRITLEVAWYRNRSSNQLVEYKLPGTTGFENVLTNFDALIENKGWEFALTSRNITGKRFNWTTSFNISRNGNKLIDFPGLASSSYYTYYKVGEPLDIRRSYIWTGVDPQTGLHTFRDVNGDGKVNYDDQTFTRAEVTRYFGGLSNTLSYAGFELSFLFQFSDRIKNTSYFPLPGIRSNQPAWVMKRWQKPGDITDVQRFSTRGAANTAYNNWRSSDAVLQDISFIKLRTLSLGYQLPQALANRWYLKTAKVFIQAQNLFSVSNFPAWDPETVYGVPPQRVISFGLQVRL